MGCGSSTTVQPPDGDAPRAEIRAGDHPDDFFKDDDFPPTPTSLFFSADKKEAAGKYIWKRPRDLSTNPHLLVEGVCSCDVAQGELGDCWFLSACAAIGTSKEMMAKVMRDNVDLNADDYDGMLTFHFWRFGKWKSVTIDDKLPTSDGEKLVFAKCMDTSEFWLPLLEKAYAKLHGTYEALEGGHEMDGLVDLTGGLAEWYHINGKDMTDQAEKLYFKRLYRAFKNESFLTCGRVGRRQYVDGLVSEHAYTITSVAYVQTDGYAEPFRLMRIKNPWANAMEWNRDWSDKDDYHWDRVSDAVKERIGFRKGEDGEFWISFDDFWKEFFGITICSIGPDFDEDGRADDAVNTIKFVYGEWKGNTAAGAESDRRPNAGNPQYLITITEPDDDDEDGDLSVVVGLMQMYRRKNITAMIEFLSIAFCIYAPKEGNPEERLTDEDMTTELARSGWFLPYREVIGRFEMKPGKYVLIPSTSKAGEDCKFMLRFYAGKALDIKEL